MKTVLLKLDVIPSILKGTVVCIGLFSVVFLNDIFKLRINCFIKGTQKSSDIGTIVQIIS